MNTPIIPASNFVLGVANEYARDDGTEGWAALETLLGGLEAGEATVFSSGMAAISAVFNTLSVHAKIVWPKDCYPGVGALIADGIDHRGWVASQLALQDTPGWQAAVKDADLIWIESPSNPLLTVADLPSIAAAPRKPGSILAVDNTLATPLTQQPLSIGADVAVHSATKFIGGHSDLLLGAAVTGDAQMAERLRAQREIAGATPGALESFLAARGLRTLAVRLEKAQANASQLAERLESHPKVSKVRYPGLTGHPTHDIAKRALTGFGAMISFDVEGDASFADRVCRSLELITHATSLGAVESTIERRAAVPGQQHLPATLLRLSVGIEHVEDLWADLDRALSRPC